MIHKLNGLFIDIRRINQNFADIRLEVVTNSTDDQTAFLINQERAFLDSGGIFYSRP